MSALQHTRCLRCGQRHSLSVDCPKQQQQLAVARAHVDCDSCGVAHKIDRQGSIDFAWCGGLPKVVRWLAWSMR